MDSDSIGDLTVSAERIAASILSIRGHRIMLDQDLLCFMEWKPER